MFEDELRYFQVEEDDYNGGYRVVFWIACYANKFGGEDAYPEELKNLSHSGNTRFLIVLKDEQGNYFEGLEYDEALEIANEYEDMFADIIRECEESARWEELPDELNFDRDDVVFYK